ncbi:MAG: hypothetical protein O2855_03110 [Planctomycetota bacterium]|nr:hypothetical protein [Planctomycetota bacterium]
MPTLAIQSHPQFIPKRHSLAKELAPPISGLKAAPAANQTKTIQHGSSIEVERVQVRFGGDGALCRH